MYFFNLCIYTALSALYTYYLILRLDQNASMVVAQGAPFLHETLRLLCTLNMVWACWHSLNLPAWLNRDGPGTPEVKISTFPETVMLGTPFNDQFRGPPNGQPGWKSHVQSLPNENCLGERLHRRMLSCRQTPPKLSELFHCLNSDRSVAARRNKKMLVRGFLVCWVKTQSKHEDPLKEGVLSNKLCRLQSCSRPVCLRSDLSKHVSQWIQTAQWWKSTRVTWGSSWNRGPWLGWKRQA